MPVTLTVNDKEHTVDASPDTPLLWALRDYLELTGTKYGCGMALCGACTVHLDDQPVRSCVTPISAVGSRKVRTIEGLQSKEAQAVQAAWEKERVPQCGYCQSGQIMSATALLAGNANPSDEAINTAMAGNICRCATYVRIRQAIKEAAVSLKNA
ncbi:(2Fe-2S)-binding protein [Candidatus Persebacteraceae bacterium Df01]|uniref:(2Fe-2S)-binding protein n=1 Tax=Candidatus Doriopsillibacter californiensis TaxID=2970740 RepID=A0ABT7QL32_9GAMM|nr:(2Fe-2S)-binding protein [Candidatus Persebacteraceae bacterium Df01]